MSDSPKSAGETDRAPIDSDVHRVIDLKGLNCPLPVLKTKKALSEMTSGELLRAITTDPMSVIDFTVFCEKSGHALEHKIEGADEFEFFIRRGD